MRNHHATENEDLKNSTPPRFRVPRPPNSVQLAQRWARSRSLILIFKITTGDLDLLGDLDQFQIDLDLWVIFDL